VKLNFDMQMKQRTLGKSMRTTWGISLFTVISVLTGQIANAQVEYVDNTIGNIGFLLEPTRPTTHLPYSMIRVHPMRADALDDQIRSFPLTLISHRLGELFSIMPGGKAPAAYDQEVASPYYYSTRFDESGIRTEFTPTERCGIFRFAFPSGKTTLALGTRQAGNLQLQDKVVVVGEERFNGMKAFVYGRLNVPVTARTETRGERVSLVLATEGSDQIEFRYGISFIDVEQARKNLEREIGGNDFEAIKRQAKARWNRELGKISVSGGTEAQRRTFYTALYRCSERMINISEDGRYYSAFDHKVHEDARPFYVDNWLWDTFRALEPLQTLINPDMQADKLHSYVRMYQQSGWMPSFAVLWGDHACMYGNHAAAWIADSWFKGVKDFDITAAFEGARKNSLGATLLPWRNGPRCSLDDFYATNGFMPALRPGEKETEPRVHSWEKRQPVPVTLENSYDDWCIAQLARVVNRPEDEQLFMKRATFYRNLYRADKGLMWPKDSEGKWIEPLDPKIDGGMGARDYYDENNGYTFAWDVIHDFDGLVALMGGREQTEANLDQLFREPLGRSKYEFWARLPDSSGMIGQFSIGNEPSFSIPYLYNRLGAPWKTQKRVRTILDAFFPATLQGIPGDEDGGGMSAFVVFSMLGIYPVTPGMPTYDIGSPIFDRAKIQLKGGKTLTIVARNNSKDNKYVQRIILNGNPLNQVWVRHADIAKGGTLELTMGNTPNKSLGADPALFPPASMNLNPAAFSPNATALPASPSKW
jgi:predicted alpha-1,2-mannosidase